jgi:hypothetical protein
MIKEITMYAAYCDNCGERWIDEETGYVAFTDTSGMRQVIEEDSHWHTEESMTFSDKHYCQKCFKGFDDDDKIMLSDTPSPPSK